VANGGILVNGRYIEYGSPEWLRGDTLAGLAGQPYAKKAGFPDATAAAHAFTPYRPPPIPTGYYDPSLDAQRDAASRGLTQTEQDIGLAGRRGAEDYGLDPNDPTYGYSTVNQINTNYGRQGRISRPTGPTRARTTAGTSRC
jgi:hypothetical protein